MQEKIKVGVIGVGIGADMHIPGFQTCPDTEVVAVCDVKQELAEGVGRNLGIPHVFTDYRKMLELDGLDAIAIATPPYLHYPMTMAALGANKHVICEKPMAMNLEEAKKMYYEAKRQKVVHMINHEFRFFPCIARVKELIDEGYLGQLLTVHSSKFYGPKNGGAFDHVTVARPWNWWSDKAQGGGLLGALGSHLIDLLRYWFGEIAGVYGQLETLSKTRKVEHSQEERPVTSDDAFAFIFRLKSGVLGTAIASSAARLAPGSRLIPSFQAYGSEGSLFLASDGILRGGRRGDDEAVELPIPERLKLPHIEGHPLLPRFMRIVEEWVRGIKEGKKVEPNFYDGMKHREVMDAISLSQSEGRWVTLSPLETE